MTAFLMIFRRFPTTFRRFLKIFQTCSEDQTKVPEHFRKFSKLSKDFRRLPKTSEEDAKMFRRYNNESNYNLRDKLDSSEIIDIFTCEDIISSHVIVQSLNSLFFPPHFGAEPGRVKRESRITRMRMLRTPPFFPPKSGENHIWKCFPDSTCDAIFWMIIYKQQFLHSDW